MEIKHDNIFYVRDITEIGGVETYVYELAKRYKDYDIAVVYKNIHPKQLERLKKYCKTYKHINEDIICKVAIINYDTSIIPYICKEAKIYETIHGDYEHPMYKSKLPLHERVYKYIAITKHIMESFKRTTGLENVILSYNPLEIEEEKRLVLVSATRMSKEKGKDRMQKLADTLDMLGINYIWYVFTNDSNGFANENVVFMQPRLNVREWIKEADYVVQLSDTEACSYTIYEAMLIGKPVIVTPLPYLEEIGIKDNVNAYILEFDCSNVKSVVERMKKVPKFKFEPLKDIYDSIVVKGKSKYRGNIMYRVRATDRCERLNIVDADLTRRTGKNVIPKAGEEWIVNEERKDFLVEKGSVIVIGEEKKG